MQQRRRRGQAHALLAVLVLAHGRPPPAAEAWRGGTPGKCTSQCMRARANRAAPEGPERRVLSGSS
eukprot:5649283-Alexandrium_andersonii.AAC.1